MQVVLLVAALVILGGVVLAALGRAGEMATFTSDIPPMNLDEVSATDVALLRPPMSLWGYNAQATEDALGVIARSVTARDVEIATLRRELADLRRDTDGGQATRTGPIRAVPAAASPAPASPVGAPAGEADGTSASGAPSAPPAASQNPDPVAAYRPPAQATASQPPAAESRPPDPAAETQPGGQAPRTEPPGEVDPRGEVDPPAEDDWLPLWQRNSAPGPDE